MEDKLNQLIEKAYRGRKLWLEMTSIYGTNTKYYVVLFPSDDSQINQIAVKYVNKIAETVDNVLVLAYDENVLSESFCDNVKTVFYNREHAEDLMQFYSLYQFTDKLIIVSLTEPEGRYAEGLVGVNGITLEEIIAIGIFGMK